MNQENYEVAMIDFEEKEKKKIKCDETLIVLI